MFAILLAHSYQVFIQVSNTHVLLLDYTKDHVTIDFVEQDFFTTPANSYLDRQGSGKMSGVKSHFYFRNFVS